MGGIERVLPPSGGGTFGWGQRHRKGHGEAHVLFSLGLSDHGHD